MAKKLHIFNEYIMYKTIDETYLKDALVTVLDRLDDEDWRYAMAEEIHCSKNHEWDLFNLYGSGAVIQC